MILCKNTFQHHRSGTDGGLRQYFRFGQTLNWWYCCVCIDVLCWRVEDVCEASSCYSLLIFFKWICRLMYYNNTNKNILMDLFPPIRRCDDPDHSWDHGLSTASPEGHEGLHHHVRQSRPGGEPGARPHPVDGGRPQLQQGVRQEEKRRGGEGAGRDAFMSRTIELIASQPPHLLLCCKKSLCMLGEALWRNILAGWNDVVWRVVEIQTNAINFTAVR